MTRSVSWMCTLWVRKTFLMIVLSLAGSLVESVDLPAAPAKTSPANVCKSWMRWTNPRTQELVAAFDRNNPNAAFAFFFNLMNESVFKFFSAQLLLEGADYPPLPGRDDILRIFNVEVDNEQERYRLEMAFEGLIVLLEKPLAEERLLENASFFSDDPATAEIEKKAFKKVADFVKVRLRGVARQNPQLAAFLLFTENKIRSRGLPPRFGTTLWNGILHAPRNIFLIGWRNLWNPIYGLGNIRYTLLTQWKILRINPFKPLAQRAAYAQQAGKLLDLRAILREAHDRNPVFLTKKPKFYHLQAIPKINDMILHPSGRQIPILPELREIFTETPAIKTKAETIDDKDDWTRTVNAASRTWSIDTLSNFAHHVQDLMTANKDTRKVEELPKKDLFKYLLEFMTADRITALVRGIEAAHRDREDFLNSKRGEVEEVLLLLQTNFDRYRAIPGLLDKNEAEVDTLKQQREEGMPVDANDLARLKEEERALKLEKVSKAEILAGLYIKAIVITEHFQLDMDPDFDELYRIDNLFRFMVKRLEHRAQAEIESLTEKERQEAKKNFVNTHGNLATDYLSGGKDPDVLLAQSARGLHTAGVFSKIPILRDIVPFIIMFGIPALTAWQAYEKTQRQDDLTKSTPWVISSAEEYVSDVEKFRRGKYSLFVAKWSVSPPTKVEIQAIEVIWDQLLESDVPLEYREKWAELTAEKAPFYYGNGELYSLSSSAEKWREAFNKPGSDLKDLLDWTIRFNYLKSRKLFGDIKLDGELNTPLSMAIPTTSLSGGAP